MLRTKRSHSKAGPRRGPVATLWGLLVGLPLVLGGCGGGGTPGVLDGGVLAPPQVRIDTLQLSKPGERPGLYITYRLKGGGAEQVDLSVELDLALRGHEQFQAAMSPRPLRLTDRGWQRGQVRVPLEGLDSPDPVPGVYTATLSVRQTGIPSTTASASTSPASGAGTATQIGSGPAAPEEDSDTRTQEFSADLQLVEVYRNDDQVRLRFRNVGNLPSGELTARFGRLDAAGGESHDEATLDAVEPREEATVEFPLTLDEAARLVIADADGHRVFGPFELADDTGHTDPYSPDLSLARVRQLEGHGGRFNVSAEVEHRGAPLDCAQGCGELVMRSFVDGEELPIQVMAIDLTRKQYVFPISLAGLPPEEGYAVTGSLEIRNVPGETDRSDNGAEFSFQYEPGTAPYPDGEAEELPTIHADAQSGEVAIRDHGVDTGLWVSYELARSSKTRMPERVTLDVSAASREMLASHGAHLAGVDETTPGTSRGGNQRFPLFLKNSSDLFGESVELTLEFTLGYPGAADETVEVPVTLRLPPSPLPELELRFTYGSAALEQSARLHPAELAGLAVEVRNAGGVDLRDGRTSVRIYLENRGRTYELLAEDAGFDALSAGGKPAVFEVENRRPETWGCHDQEDGWPAVQSLDEASLVAVVRVSTQALEVTEEVAFPVIVQGTDLTCGQSL